MEKEMDQIPKNMKAAVAWMMTKFALDPNCEHIKDLAIYTAQKLAESLPKEQSEIDTLITSYLEEVGG